MSGTLLVEREGRVALLTLHRPDKRNALNAELRVDLRAALAHAASDGTRAVILTGAGDKAFAAGADLDEMAARTPLEQRAYIMPPHVYDAVRRFPGPVIAAVNGLALGAGCELASACDYRIASSAAKFGQPEIALGLIPGGGGTQRLPRLIGPGRAARLVLSGETIDAPTALAWGLADEVVEPAQLLPRARTLAATFAEKSATALRLAKQALVAAEERPMSEGLAREIDLFALAFTSADAKEGIAAFREKRKPVWK
ncbi:MAG: enoyl-CoA hydratase/isomerase family protein [Thermoplasmatota archaeon]